MLQNTFGELICVFFKIWAYIHTWFLSILGVLTFTVYMFRMNIWFLTTLNLNEWNLRGSYIEGLLRWIVLVFLMCKSPLMSSKWINCYIYAEHFISCQLHVWVLAKLKSGRACSYSSVQEQWSALGFSAFSWLIQCMLLPLHKVKHVS